MWSRTGLIPCHMWVEFVLGSCLALRVFLGSLVFLLLQKPTSSNSNSIRIEDTCTCIIPNLFYHVFLHVAMKMEQSGCGKLKMKVVK